MGSQQPVRNAVKCTEPCLALAFPGSCSIRLRISLAALLKVSANAAWGDPLHLNQPGNPVYQHLGFPTARPRQHQQWLVEGKPLRAGHVQPIQNRRNIHSRTYTLLTFHVRRQDLLPNHGNVDKNVTKLHIISHFYTSVIVGSPAIRFNDTVV